MPLKRAKIFFVFLIMFAVFFFTNDFGLIDIEKTAIITAVGIDKGDNLEYTVTAQIAVPEASNVSSENAKTHITGHGETVGSAIKNVGDVSGWFPNLSFCNLIILGSSFSQDNVITVLDYFTKTLRIQDSAIVVLAQNKASELIEKSTPLDNISSFALQKVLLKNPGHDKDTATVDIKTFCVGYYSYTNSSYMPFVKGTEESKESDGGSSGSSGSSMGALGSGSSGSLGSDNGLDGKGKALFDARSTALFKNGKFVGVLTPDQTFMFNAITKSVSASTVEISDVPWSNGNKNFLLTIERNSPKIQLDIIDGQPVLNVHLDVYCKISDQNTDSSEHAYTKNYPLPTPVKEKATELLTNQLDSLIQTSISTDCDFLDLKLKLYRYHHDRYSQFKDSILSVMKYSCSVNVTGQR